MKPIHSRLSLFLSLCSLCLCGESRAQDLSKPYNLHIVVHVAQNRLLTDVFRERIERELRDGFRAALGDMGRVTVTHEHPRLPDVLARGLKHSLDGWKDRSDVKTHFVLIDFSGVHYEIQARQYDGTIGRASPVVRRDRTRDRDFVAKAAALLIKQDFGILGTVVTAADGPQQQVKVELRGGALGNLSRWVQKDEVFALAPPGGGSSPELNWALVQVREAPREDARDGVCMCRFFNRYQVPSIVGYRCIKLGTIQAPLRLRWVQETPPGRPLDGSSGLTVDIRRHGFTGEEATKLQKSPGRNGLMDTVRDGDKGVFNHVAFVSVVSGPPPRPRVPVAIVDDQPVVIEVNIRQPANTLFSVRKAAWQSSVSDSLLLQVRLFKELEGLAAQAEKREEIIEKAKRGLQRSQQDRDSLMDEKKKLLKEAKHIDVTLDTTRENQRLKEMEAGEEELRRFIAEQQKIEASENDPKMKKWKSEVERAKLLEKDLEFGKAIDIYKQIQREGFQDTGLDSHLKKLQELWKTVDAKHKEARNFIYRVWPTLDTERLEENLPKARQAFAACQKAGDIISIRKLLKGTEVHADHLSKELNGLNPKINIDDEEPAKQLTKVSSQVVKLGKDIEGYLKAHASDK